jgi:hypothetical protein
VRELSCPQCDTRVQGQYALPLILQLKADEQDFLMKFLKASGSLKEMAKQLGYSYPKVRKMLDDLIERVNFLEEQQEKNAS